MCLAFFAFLLVMSIFFPVQSLMFLVILIIIGIMYKIQINKSINEAVERYGANREFIKKNKFYENIWFGSGGTRIWKEKHLQNIIDFFDNSPREIFSNAGEYIVLYENKSILICQPGIFWQYIPYESIYDIKVMRRDMAIKGAIGGKIVFGDIGAYSGSDRIEITVNIITNGFDTPNFDFTLKDQYNISRFSNTLYYLYDK